jgi:hypothetical protein
MPKLNRDRSQFFKVISGVTFYMGKEGAESEAGQLHVGSVLYATIETGEKRTLDGQRIPVILFKIGADGKGLYWLPRNDFYRCTESSTKESSLACLFRCRMTVVIRQTWREHPPSFSL